MKFNISSEINFSEVGISFSIFHLNSDSNLTNTSFEPNDLLNHGCQPIENGMTDLSLLIIVNSRRSLFSNKVNFEFISPSKGHGFNILEDNSIKFCL